MKERILKNLSISDVIDIFGNIKWKFVEVDPDSKKIIIEVPRGTDESFVVELESKDLKADIKKLRDQGFIEQEIRYRG